MKKGVALGLSIVALVVAIVAVFSVAFSFGTKVVEGLISGEGFSISNITTVSRSVSGEEVPNYMSWSVEDLVQEVHEMSHQKIYAEQKWGFSLITDEKLEALIYAFNNNPDVTSTKRNLALPILERWQDGDFSNAVEDHNKIWILQGGTIGQAKRLLTENEEKRYIEKKLNKD